MPLSFSETARAKAPGVRGVKSSCIARSESAWGYVLTKQSGLKGAQRWSHRQLEIALRALSVFSFVMMAGLWVLPGARFDLEVLGFKLAMSLAFGLIGVAFGSLSDRGLRRDIHVDQQRGQIRIVWRNYKGEMRLHSVIGFEEIGSVFLRRAPMTSRHAQLDLRYGAHGRVVTLFEGAETVLRDLWHDLNADLHVGSTPAGAHSVQPATVSRDMPSQSVQPMRVPAGGQARSQTRERARKP